MAKKLGDVAIALAFLLFIVGGFSYILVEIDNTLGVSSGEVKNTFYALNNNVSEVKLLESDLTQKIDNTSNLDETGDNIETEGAEGLGIINFFGKNIISKFIREVSNRVPGAKYILGLVASLIAITISILITRAWRGETKI